MCFDEATSALDTETEREIQKSIDEVSKESTSLIIAHRLSTVRNADKIIVLKLGVIVEQGSHDELVQMENGYYRRLWEKQSADDEAIMQAKLWRQHEEEERERILNERIEMRKNSTIKGARPEIQ